jgi:hypothetical protein
MQPPAERTSHYNGDSSNLGEPGLNVSPISCQRRRETDETGVRSDVALTALRHPGLVAHLLLALVGEVAEQNHGEPDRQPPGHGDTISHGREPTPLPPQPVVGEYPVIEDGHRLPEDAITLETGRSTSRARGNDQKPALIQVVVDHRRSTVPSPRRDPPPEWAGNGREVSDESAMYLDQRRIICIRQAVPKGLAQLPLMDPPGQAVHNGKVLRQSSHRT